MGVNCPKIFYTFGKTHIILHENLYTSKIAVSMSIRHKTPFFYAGDERLKKLKLITYLGKSF